MHYLQHSHAFVHQLVVDGWLASCAISVCVFNLMIINWWVFFNWSKAVLVFKRHIHFTRTEFIDSIYSQRVFTTFELINCYGEWEVVGLTIFFFRSLSCMLSTLFYCCNFSTFNDNMLFCCYTLFNCSIGNLYTQHAPTLIYNFVTSRFILFPSTRLLLFQLINDLKRFKLTRMYFIAADIRRKTPISMNQRTNNNDTNTFHLKI